MLHHRQVCFLHASHFATLNIKKNWDLTKLAFCNASSRMLLAEAGIFFNTTSVCGSGEYPDCKYSGHLCLSSCQGTRVLPALIFAWSVQYQHREKNKKEKTNNILVSWKLFLIASVPWKWLLLVCGQHLQTAEANMARDYLWNTGGGAVTFLFPKKKKKKNLIIKCWGESYVCVKKYNC